MKQSLDSRPVLVFFPSRRQIRLSTLKEPNELNFILLVFRLQNKKKFKLAELAAE